jgi:hypothetical protein
MAVEPGHRTYVVPNAAHYILLAFAILFGVLAAAAAFGWFGITKDGSHAIGYCGISLALGWAAHF